jgi:hypothetical protein
VKLTFAIAVVVSFACTSPQIAGACGPRPYGDVSAWLEAADDASRVGDFDLALSYANSARSAATSLPSDSFAACGRDLADVYREQAQRRIAFVVTHGRSADSIAAAKAMPLVFRKTFNCP